MTPRACLRFLLSLALLAASGIAFAQEGVTWRKVDRANLVFIGMREGEIVLELNPAFAPKTVARFRERVGSGFYRGLSFYRVIDGFVAQAGDHLPVYLEPVVERVALRAMLPPTGRTLIEIGAGFGRLADLYKGYDTVVIFDYASTQLTQAVERLGEGGVDGRQCQGHQRSAR